MTVYELTRVTKVYDARTVLNISNLRIDKNRIYALLGPNGAGKTTLLNILGFLERPTGGNIYFRSKPVRFVESELQALRRQVILVGQSPILFTTTVSKNLEFGLKVRKIAKRDRIRVIEEALDLVGMREFMSAQAHRLSGGETQRVALARALALSPEIFLCDEPTSSVDAENQLIILNILKRINETKRMTILFTTHDRAQAEAIADQTIVLDKGRLIRTGYENIYSADISHSDEGEKKCKILPELSLLMTRQEASLAKQRIRVCIDPNQIELCGKTDEQGLPNILQGKVQQVVHSNSKIRIIVSSGIRLTILMSENTYRQNRIFVGDTIRFYIPPKAIRPIE